MAMDDAGAGMIARNRVMCYSHAGSGGKCPTTTEPRRPVLATWDIGLRN
jgi:hypothetical protein